MATTVTSQIQGITINEAIKAPCATVALTNITLAGFQTISGVTITANSSNKRVLVKGQSNPVDNGIYDMGSGSWQRSKDFDGNRDVVQGARVLVINTGITGAEYELTTANPIVIGTTGMAFQIRYSANATYNQTEAEIAASVTPTNREIPSHDAVGYVIPARYSLVNDAGAADQTAILNTAYSVAKQAKCPMRLPPWRVRFTSTLDWDGSVSVYGDNYEYTVLEKDGNFNGIEVDGLTGAASQIQLEGFTVSSTNVLDTTGKGIVVSGAHVNIRRVQSSGHGSHGFDLAGTANTGYFCHYDDLIATSNGGNGVHVSGAQFRGYFTNLQLLANTGWGFNVSSPSAYHVGHGITCEQNAAGGAQIAGQQCYLEIYGESNTGPDISLTSNSVRNYIINTHIDSYPSDLLDAGTDNQITSISGVGAFMTPSITRPKRTTNVAGLGIVMLGGAGGPGASPVAGGPVLVQGGDADGTGNSPGGQLTLNGGDPVGTSPRGLVAIQDNANGNVVIGAASQTAAKAVLELTSTTKAFLPPKMTTTQKNAISPAAIGMVVFDITLGKLCVFGNSTTWETVTSS